MSRARDGKVGKSVMLRESFVEEGVIALNQFEHAAVFAHDVTEKQFRLAAHGLTQLRIQLRALRASPAVPEAASATLIARGTFVAGQHRAGLNRYGLDIAGLEPLAAEIFRQRR